MTKNNTIIVFSYANKNMYMLIQLNKVNSGPVGGWGEGGELIPQKMKRSKIKVPISKVIRN